VKPEKKGFKQAEGGMKKLVAAAKVAAVAFAALKIGKFVKGIVEDVAKVGDQFDKMAKRSGFATDTLQELQHVAELSGASIEGVETVIKKLQQSQVEAGKGIKTYTEEFDRLGVDIKDSEGKFKDTTDLLFEMADAMNELDTDAERTAVAMRLMGRGGTALIPFFKEGSEGIREMMKEMSAFGAVMEEDLIDASAEYIDNQQRMTLVTRGLKNAVARELLPMINKSTEQFLEWWKINGKIIRQRIGSFFKGLARILKNVVRFFANIAKTSAKFVKGLTPLEKGLLKIGAAITLIGFLINKGPIGKILLLITLIGLIIDDFQTWKEGGDSLTGDLVNAFNDILGIDIVSWVNKGIEIFGGFAVAVKVGAGAIIETLLAIGMFFVNIFTTDLETAWKILVHELQLIWKQLWDWVETSGAQTVAWVTEWLALFLDPIVELWQQIKMGFVDLWNDVVAGIMKFVEKVKAPFQKVAGFLDSIFGSGETKGSPKIETKVKTGSPKILGMKSVIDASKVRGAGALAGGAGVSAAPTNNITTVDQRTDVKIDVKGTPGMNEGTLASEVARQVKQVIDKKNRSTMKAFTPATGGI
jgi:hypothetical protein